MKKIILASAAVAAMTMGSSVWAAGGCGAADATNNVCTTVVTATINKKIIVTGLDALNMGTYTGAALTKMDNFCVGTNSKDGATLAFTSANAGSSFSDNTGGTANLENGTGTTLAYTVTVSVTEDNLACLGSDSSITVGVTTTAADAVQVDGTAFTDTITITATPT